MVYAWFSESEDMVLDNFLLAGRRLQGLGGLCVRLEALVLLDEGDEQVPLAELEVAPDLLARGRHLLQLGLGLEAGDHLGEAVVVERAIHRPPAHELGVANKFGVPHLSRGCQFSLYHNSNTGL